MSAVASNIGQYLDTGPRFGGMSGVDYALFGYCWMQSRFNPRGGIYISPNTVVMMIVWLFICILSKSAGDIANAAHLVGLAVGIISGYVADAAQALMPGRKGGNPGRRPAPAAGLSSSAVPHGSRGACKPAAGDTAFFGALACCLMAGHKLA